MLTLLVMILKLLSVIKMNHFQNLLNYFLGHCLNQGSRDGDGLGFKSGQVTKVNSRSSQHVEFHISWISWSAVFCARLTDETYFIINLGQGAIALTPR